MFIKWTRKTDLIGGRGEFAGDGDVGRGRGSARLQVDLDLGHGRGHNVSGAATVVVIVVGGHLGLEDGHSLLDGARGLRRGFLLAAVGGQRRRCRRRGRRRLLVGGHGLPSFLPSFLPSRKQSVFTFPLPFFALLFPSSHSARAAPLVGHLI